MNYDKRVLIIGATPQGLQAALNLACLGKKVVLIDDGFEIGKHPNHWGDKEKRWIRTLTVQVTYHPLIEVWTETKAARIKGGSDGIEVELFQGPQWITPQFCAECQKCLAHCPVELTNEQKPLFHLIAPNILAIDKRKRAPCRSTCPLEMNVQGYVALIARGRFDEAYELIMETNPLPGLCGRVCHHPCEEVCRRSEIDEPVAICSLKRFAAHMVNKDGRQGQGRISGTTINKGPRVAIVGSGPAGLTAASDLAKAGFRPTLVETESEPGGLLRHGIAPYRLPRKILDEEIAAILALGVDLRLNTTVNSGDDLDKLKAEGFEYILLTTGASQDRWMKINGEDLKGIYGCVSFLNRLWKGNGPGSLGRVVVIGGGNAAVEAARAGIRSGARSVTILYRRSKMEMPADPHEIEQALEEGVKIRCLTLPVEFEGRGNRLSRIKCIRMKLEELDSSGRPKPIPIEESDFTINADTAIVSIGQQAKPFSGTDSYIETTRGGAIKTSCFGESNIPGIYASGDAVSGPSTVVEAMASGRQAAKMIIRASNHSKMPQRDEVPDSILGEYDPIPKGFPRQKRRPIPHRDIIERKTDLKEVIGPFTEKEALREASRCLQCGICSECLKCEDACDLDAVDHTRTSSQSSIPFYRIIVADNGQITTGFESPRVVRVPSGKRISAAKAMVDGRVAAVEVLSTAPLKKTKKIPRKTLGNGGSGIAIFLCSCNGTLNENGRLNEVATHFEATPGVSHVEILTSACHPEKGRKIEEAIGKKESNGALIASCTCCHLDFVCESCNDQRIRLKHRLFGEEGYEQKDIVLVNIKETCLLPLKNEGKRAIEQTVKVIRSGLWQLRDHKERSLISDPPNPKAMVLGATEAGIAAAKCLKNRLVSVVVIEDKVIEKKTENELRNYGIDLIQSVRPVRLDGQQGKFTLIVEKIDTLYPKREQRGPKGHSTRKGKSPPSPESKTIEEDPRYQRIPAGLVILGKSEFKEIPYKRDAFAGKVRIGKRHSLGTLETDVPGVYFASWTQTKKSLPEDLGKASASEAIEGIFGTPDQIDSLVANVDPELCRGCTRCADICPEGAARLQETARGTATSWIEPRLCTGCGNCMAECPTGAIHMPESDQGYFEKVMDVYLG